MEYMDKPLSNIDINKAIKKFEERGANIFSDSNIKNNTNIEEIFKNRGHAIIFHKYPNQDVGHWYCILRDPMKNVFFIDSFGLSPNYYNKSIIPCLKNNGIKNIIVNKEKWQKDDSSICGRYGILMSTLHKFDMPISDVYKFMEHGKKKYGSFDKFVLHLTT